MSNQPALTIAGDNDLATNAARHAIAAVPDDPVYLWRSIADPLVSKAPVVILADAGERAGFAQAALNAGLPTVSLPIKDLDVDLKQAIADGRLRLMSTLHGLPTLARLQQDATNGAVGRRYGVFVSHRIPTNFVDELDDVVDDLVTYCCSLIDSSLTRVSVTTSDLGTSATAGWFILARFADETIATIEVAAVLPEADESAGELLIEVTGSEAVLRAAPEQQGVLIRSAEGVSRSNWYADPSDFLLQRATNLRDSGNETASLSTMKLMQKRFEAATANQAVEV